MSLWKLPLKYLWVWQPWVESYRDSDVNSDEKIGQKWHYWEMEPFYKTTKHKLHKSFSKSLQSNHRTKQKKNKKQRKLFD